MAFNFIEIEKKKSRIIAAVFFVIVVFYFTGVWLLILFARSIMMSLAMQKFVLFLPPARLTQQVLGASFAIGIMHWLLSVHNVIERMCAAVDARPTDEQDEYHLYFRNIVNEVSVAIGGRHIDPMVIHRSDLNAFAVADFSGRAVIGVTEGLLCRLNRSQIEAVVAHEAAHIISGDCLATTVTSALGEFYEELFGVINGLGTLLRAFVSREREYRADALAVRITRDPAGLAQALYQISSHWRGEGARGSRLSSIFIVNPRFEHVDEAGGFFADILSTHPPIRARIAVLAQMAHLSEEELDLRLKDFRRISPVLPHGVGFDDGAAFNRIMYPGIKAPDPGHSSRDSCPKCAAALISRNYEGAPVSICTICGGTLVDQDRLTRILYRRDAVYSPNLARLCQTILENLMNFHVLPRIPPRNAWVIKCPACNSKMHREFYASSYAVEIDRCLSCSKVWFDKNELEILQYLFEHNKELFAAAKGV